MKKVSSAPSHEPDDKDDGIVNSKACESGIEQWCEAIEKHMPLTLLHSSQMVRFSYCLFSIWFLHYVLV